MMGDSSTQTSSTSDAPFLNTVFSVYKPKPDGKEGKSKCLDTYFFPIESCVSVNGDAATFQNREGKGWWNPVSRKDETGMEVAYNDDDATFWITHQGETSQLSAPGHAYRKRDGTIVSEPTGDGSCPSCLE